MLVAGCGAGPQSSAATPVPTPDSTTSTQQCAQAVLTVLSAMASQPYDGQPVQDFLTRYSTTSAAYTAYRNSFTAFFNQASEHGVQAAEDAVRTQVQRDCSAT